MKRLYLLFYALYPLALANILMAPYTTGYGLFNFLSFIPRSIRYVEVPVVVLGYIFTAAYASPTHSATKEPVGFVPLALLALAGSLGLLASGASFIDTSQAVYTYSMPILVFGTLWNLSLTNGDFLRWRAVMHIAVGTNVFLGLVQVLKFDPRQNADAVNGLMRDAHNLGNFLFIYLLLELGYLLQSGRTARMLLLFPVLFVACATFNEKSILFFAILASGVLLLGRGVSLRSRLLAVGAVTVLALALFQIIHAEDVTGFRTGALLKEDLSTLGTVQGYTQLGDVFREHPTALVWGVGAGNYGSSIALRRAVNGEDLSPVAMKYNPWMVEISALGGAYDLTSNYFTGLLVEHGLVAIVCVAYALFVIANRVLRGKQERTLSTSPLRLATVASMVFLTLNGLVTNVSSWDELSLTVPVMFYAAYLSQGEV